MKYTLSELAMFHRECLEVIEDKLTNEGVEMFCEIQLVLYALEEKHGPSIAIKSKTK